MAHLVVRTCQKNPSIRPSHRRSRTLSQFSVSSESSKLTFDSSKLATITIGSYNASGSFSPTTSAKASLISIKGPSRKWPSLDLPLSKQPLVPLWHGDEVESPPPSPETASPSSPSSPLSIKSSLSSIPSISRTSSSFSASDALSERKPKASLAGEGRHNKLHPVLAACEKMSRVSSQAVCSTCMKPGYDYPRCAKCGDMWCSRACRLRDGVKRHICSRTNM